MLLSVTSYYCGRDVFHADSARLKSDSFKKKPQANHCGRWRSVKTRNKNRLILPQILIGFFCHETRLLQFEPFIGRLNTAIVQLGRFF